MVTLFHKASSPASVRVHTLLKQASANAAEYATEDQASDHSAQTSPKRAEFQLDVTEEPPTSDQLRTILEYMGGGKAAGLLVKGAVSENDALKKLKENADNFQRPLVCGFAPPAVGGPFANEACRRWIGITERLSREQTSRRF